jgi:hypothetical protein
MALDKITIGTAGWLAKSNNLDGVAIFAFDNGELKSVSYGRTRKECSDLAKLIDRVCEQIEDGRIPLPSLDTGGLTGQA